MNYPDFRKLSKLQYELVEYARLKCEQGNSGATKDLILELERILTDVCNQIQELPDDETLFQQEPDDLNSIQALRRDGPRKIWSALPDDETLYDKLAGALYGRVIGCLLGVPVEGMTVESIQGWCDFIGKQFPPIDYWENIEMPYIKNCYNRHRYEYLKHTMTYAPVDDDIIYTQLALLIMEECGVDFTTEDVGRVWCKYVPFACTAEEVAIKNLKKDIPIDLVGVTDNPYRQWIGAAIRSDGFAFASAGYPEKAASMAYYDGYLSHRRNGIYGEMFLAAAQSAAFTVSDPIEAIKIGLTEIPKNCTLYHDIEWALDQCATVTNYLDARRLVDQRFAGMHQVHTNNNLCLIVFGLKIGGLDIVKTLSQLIAMGLDNDCTAASAGSIVGAIIGKNAIPNYLCERFHNTMDTYLLEVEKFQFDDMAKRFMKIAKSIYH